MRVRAGAAFQWVHREGKMTEKGDSFTSRGPLFLPAFAMSTFYMNVPDGRERAAVFLPVGRAKFGARDCTSAAKIQ
jgi:hypothetical protein